ncbi:RICIN domain-containing protein [Aliterella atlantica]|uniref:RICIN domain-containing protein n=1 Tax=Aliterella atlantica TaxID=1827278 RepID=UPI000698D98E|nr:RICIN domain-containing protein [Aliterella atlantica]
MKFIKKKQALAFSVLAVVGVTCSISGFFALNSPQALACDGFLGQFDPTCDRSPKPRVIDGEVSVPGDPPPGFILNSLSGQCIDVAGAPGNTNGAQIQLWNCELSGRNIDNGSSTDQKWELTSDGFIRNTLSGKCIDVAGAPGNRNGTQLQLWDCEFSGRNADNGSETDQTWTLTRDGFLLNISSGKCIDVVGAPGRGRGTRLQLWTCEFSGRNADNGSETDQIWKL